jgi:hypothetical protein
LEHRYFSAEKFFLLGPVVLRKSPNTTISSGHLHERKKHTDEKGLGVVWLFLQYAF